MVEFGKSLDPDEEYDVLFNILDFPIECVEGDEIAADWDISKAQFLGPIPSSVLMEPPMAPNEEFDAPNLLPQPAAPISAAPEHVGTHISGERKFAKVQSPVSVLESNGSSSRGKSLSAISEHTIPARSRSKRVRYSGTNPWILAAHELSTSKRTPNAEKSKQSRKRLCQQPVSIDLTRNTSENVDNSSTISNPADQGASNALVKKCSHCQSTKTPQWREGPLGPKTLCNACGVRYRSGRLFPEYRPAASPTFVPSQHSNSHRKVVEMRNEAKQVKVEAKVAPLSTQAAAKQVKVETKISGAPVQKQLIEHVEQMQLTKDVDTSSSLQIAPTPKRDKYDDTSSSHISLQNKSVMVQESCASSTQSRASLLQSNSYLRYRAKYTALAGLNPCLPPSPSKKASNSMKVPIAVSVDVSENFPQNDATSLDVTDPVRLQNASNSMRGNKERRTKKLSQLQKVARKCAHCQSKNKTHWREGPLGPLMLCNACGLRYRSGRLLPESRQAACPMLVPYQTSNSHGEILQMRGEAMQSRDDTEMISGAPVQKQLTKHVDTSSSLEIAPTPKRKLLAEYADTHISDIPLQNKSAEVQESCASSTRSRVSLLESSSYLRYRSKYAKLAGVSPCLPPSPCKKASNSTKKSFEVPIAVPVDVMKNSPKNDDTSLDVSEPARLQNASNSVRHKESRKKKLSQLLMDVDVMKSSHKSEDGVSDPPSLQKVVKKCAHCQSKKTTQWRGGPLGALTLCNPCGLRYKSGRLFPEYRPAASPTFMPYQTSNSHREVMKMRIEAMQSRDDDSKVTLTSPQPDFCCP